MEVYEKWKYEGRSGIIRGEAYEEKWKHKRRSIRGEVEV